MKDRRHSERWREELEGYFAGRLGGQMGLRSWLGPMLERGFMPPSTSTGSAPVEPGNNALEAARATNRVEHALALVGRRHARILAAFHLPHGPDAPWGLRVAELRGVAAVAVEIEDDVAAVFREEDAVRGARDDGLRLALRRGSDEEARSALELAEMAPCYGADVTARLRGMAAVRGPFERRVLRRVATVARQRTGDAHLAFAAAWRRARQAEREARLGRLQQTMERHTR